MSDTPRTDAIFKMLRRAQKQVSSREDWIALQEGAKNGVEYLERELADMTAERDKLRDVLHRHGFVPCDIPACNCGSWHPRYGYPERMQEIKDALAKAGHELDNSNGNLPLNALKQLIAERDRMRPVVEAAQRWRHSNFAGDESELTSAVDTYEAATCPSATEAR